MTILKETTPVARKEHRCMYCHGIISKGQKYLRQTNAYDGYVGDWVCHQECHTLAHELCMFDDCPDNGLDDEEFGERVSEYIYDEHYDSEADDVAKEWQGLTKHQEVLKILDELEVE